MAPLPDVFVTHLREYGYHPRSNKHSDALALAIIADLLRTCPAIMNRAATGDVVFDLNFDLQVKTASWNVDLVLGRAPSVTLPASGPIRRTHPSTVQIAIEIKSVMTEHRKAVKNRKRDLEAHHEHVHNYDDKAIAGGVMVVNQSPQFASPLRPAVSTHGRGDKKAVALLVEHCLTELRNVSERSAVGQKGLDAKCALVLDMDNINLESTGFGTRVPAPQVGDPLHYDSFLQRICAQYESRFS